MSIKHLRFDDSAFVLFGSITASYVNLLALSDDIDILFVVNSTDAAVYLSIPSGVVGIERLAAVVSLGGASPIP